MALARGSLPIGECLNSEQADMITLKASSAFEPPRTVRFFYGTIADGWPFGVGRM